MMFQEIAGLIFKCFHCVHTTLETCVCMQRGLSSQYTTNLFIIVSDLCVTYRALCKLLGILTPPTTYDYTCISLFNLHSFIQSETRSIWLLTPSLCVPPFQTTTVPSLTVRTNMDFWTCDPPRETSRKSRWGCIFPSISPVAMEKP